MESIIKVIGAGKSYAGCEEAVLKDISMEIKEGESVAIVGPSGAGKSTLLNCLGLCMNFSSGTYILQGRDTFAMKEKEYANLRNSLFGYVTQDFSLIVGMSVYENAVLPLHYAKKHYTKAEKEKLCRKALQSVGLEEKMQTDIGKLSGGQKQRVAIARALIANQSIIIADEPTGALDSENSDAIMNLLLRLNEDGKTLILVTHNREIACRCARVVELKDGQIVKDERNKEL